MSAVPIYIWGCLAVNTLVLITEERNQTLRAFYCDRCHDKDSLQAQTQLNEICKWSCASVVFPSYLSSHWQYQHLTKSVCINYQCCGALKQGFTPCKLALAMCAAPMFYVFLTFCLNKSCIFNVMSMFSLVPCSIYSVSLLSVALSRGRAFRVKRKCLFLSSTDLHICSIQTYITN